MGLGLQKGPELLRDDLLERVARQLRLRQCIAFVHQPQRCARQQQRLVERHLDLDAAQRLPLPRQLDMHAERLLPIGMLRALRIAVDCDLEATHCQQQLTRDPRRVFDGRFEPKGRRCVDCREVEVLGVSIVGEVALAKSGATLEHKRSSKWLDSRDAGQDVGQHPVLLNDVPLNAGAPRLLAKPPLEDRPVHDRGETLSSRCQVESTRPRR